MKLKLITIFAALMLLSSLAVSQELTEVTVDNVTNTTGAAIDSLLLAGSAEHVFSLRFTNNTGCVFNTTNGFRVYSPDGATWGSTAGAWTGSVTWTSEFLNPYSADGMAADTIGFGGLSFDPNTAGLQPGYDDIAVTITIGPTLVADNGKTICIDSSWYRPSNTWKWASLSGGCGQLTQTSDTAMAWGGPYCWTLSTGTDVSEIEGAELPTEYSLAQNYPNPFNPSTQIEFALPEHADVSITIYNVLGQQIVELVNEELPAGRYVETWDGRSGNGNPVASGIYFYKLEAGSFVETRKMMLLK